MALAAFLFRDHGLVLKKPAISNALSLFRSEFGLRSSVEDEAATFDLLFRDDSDDFEDADLVPADQAEG